MVNAYEKNNATEDYLNFLESENGRIQQQLLFDALLKNLPQNPNQKILDAACGPGWLTDRLTKYFPRTEGCDASIQCITYAKKRYPNLSFNVADLTTSLPYEPESFEAVVLNMAAPDIGNLAFAYQNIFTVLKSGGRLLVTVPNPYLSYPAAAWHRNFWEFLTLQKPKLTLKPPPNATVKITREFGQAVIGSFYHPLPDYFNAAWGAGFILARIEEIRASHDSKKFDFNYTFFRYPLVLLLEFEKPTRL